MKALIQKDSEVRKMVPSLAVNRKIKLLYGNDYGVTEIKSEKGKETSITIKIRSMTREELSAYVQGTVG